MEKKYLNVGFVFLLLIPITFLGFYRNYFSKFSDFYDINFYIHVHAFIALSWLFLLITQPFLIRSRKYGSHRKLGKISYFIFPLLILSFIPLMINMYNNGDFSRLLFPLMDISLLLVFYTLAIRNRKNTAIHMRYMIAIPLVFLSPTLGRILNRLLSDPFIDSGHILYGSINLMILVLIFWDRANDKNYQPYMVALSGFIVYETLYHIIFL